MISTVNVDIIEQFIQLRAAVGFLGEKDQFRWWDTAFLGPTGQKYLAINFPRSALAAGMNAVTAAAKRLHDSRIGKGGVYHLFRMPVAIEEKLHRQLLEALPDSISPFLQSKEGALQKLKLMFESGVSASEGPVQVGTEKKILSNFAVEEMAKHYYDAFATGKQTFPYFAADGR
jgi:hypothetical protein